MNEASRTKRTLQNSRVSITLFLLQIIVGFYSRKIFLDYLGTEILGLNTTLGNILNFLNLAELGVGTAMATSLYKPIHNDDHESIREIISMEGLLYRRVAIVLGVLGLLTMVALPFIFPHTECGLFYVYVAFGVFLSGSLMSYLWNYRQVLISADQKGYKLQPWRYSVRFVKIGLQIFFLLVVHWGIWGWIFWEFVGNVVMVFVINAVLKKEYPWLHASRLKGKDLYKKYNHLIKMTKQLVVHKLAYYVMGQTTPLVIYAFVSLTMVAYYSNYMVIVSYLVAVINLLFMGMGASIGSLVVEGNRKHTLDVFEELLVSRVWISSMVCFGMYLFTGPFIIWWIGEKYLLSELTLVLMILGAFLNMSRGIIDPFKEAYQLFGDIWAPIAEAVINLGAAVLLGHLWGLNGVLLGSNLGLIIMVVFWKPYYVFKHGLKMPCINYYLQYGLILSVLSLCAFLSVYLFKELKSGSTMTQLFYYIAVYLVFSITSYLVLLSVTSGMRRFNKRVWNIMTSHQV